MTEEQGQRQAHGAELPAALGEVLAALAQRLHGDLGDALHSVVVYGSAARADWDPKVSDVNLMVVLSTIDLDTLDRARAALAIARRTAPVDAMFLTPEDLERSADVFPLRFLDIARTHAVIWGDDPMRDLDIAWDHLRLRVEQEIKQLMFRLRERYIASAHRPEELARVLTGSLSTFFAGVGALLYLEDQDWWITGKEAVARAASEQLDYDEALLNRLMALYRGDLSPTPDQVRVLYAHTMKLVERAAARVDRLEQD